MSSIKKGLGFGVTSGIITTLGLMIGLYSSTYSKFVVLGGVISIAIADSLSDALGMHLSEEVGNKNSSHKSIWTATISTFICKFIFSGLFIIPIILWDLKTAIIVSLFLGFVFLTLFSYYIAKHRRESPIKAILEHIGIAIIVIVITYFVGTWIRGFS